MDCDDPCYCSIATGHQAPLRLSTDVEYGMRILREKSSRSALCRGALARGGVACALAWSCMYAQAEILHPSQGQTSEFRLPPQILKSGHTHAVDRPSDLAQTPHAEDTSKTPKLSPEKSYSPPSRPPSAREPVGMAGLAQSLLKRRDFSGVYLLLWALVFAGLCVL